MHVAATRLTSTLTARMQEGIPTLLQYINPQEYSALANCQYFVLRLKRQVEAWQWLGFE